MVTSNTVVGDVRSPCVRVKRGSPTALKMKNLTRRITRDSKCKLSSYVEVLETDEYVFYNVSHSDLVSMNSVVRYLKKKLNSAPLIVSTSFAPIETHLLDSFNYDMVIYA